jgi:Ran-binding protein 1
VWCSRAKLFCFRETLLDKGTGKKTWCERGVGEAKFLKHKEHQKVRLLMRQEKTLKIIVNHLVDSRTELSPNMGSDRAWVFSCYDFAEGTLETQVFALRFGNAEAAQKFKEAHDNAKKTNKALEAGADADDTAAGDAAAKALEGLDVKKEVRFFYRQPPMLFIHLAAENSLSLCVAVILRDALPLI